MKFWKRSFQGDEIKERSCIICVLVFFFVTVLLSVVAAIFSSVSLLRIRDEKPKPLNVLFIVVDDLRPALGCYGDKLAKTWNIDQLARKSVVFKNAYAQQALCAPSRTSFLTSRRPDTLHLYDNGSFYWRDVVGNFTTLPQHFKDNGYQTISIGKVFHHGHASNKTDDYPYSWSKEPYHPSSLDHKNAKVCPGADGELHMNVVCPVFVPDQPEETLPDLQNTQTAINYLQNKSKGPDKDIPFFLGVGYYKPHVPFKVDNMYYDLFPGNSMPLAENGTTRPPKMPPIAWNPWQDLRTREDVEALHAPFPYGPLPVDFQKSMRIGYYASVAYIDDQIGELLAALERSGYASNTVIVLVGDHGWSLGEHQEWSKYSNFEVAVKVPLLVHMPGITVDYESDPGPHFPHVKVLNKTGESEEVNHGMVTDAFVELVDLFPSLSEIVNIAVPPLCKINSTEEIFCSEGLSFWPVVRALYHKEPYVWKKAVFHQYPRPSVEPSINSDQPALRDIHFMGYSMRTREYRYTEWVRFNNKTLRPDRTLLEDRELYDETSDAREDKNIEAEFPYIISELSKQLRAGWRGAMPPGLFNSKGRPIHH